MRLTGFISTDENLRSINQFSLFVIFVIIRISHHSNPYLSFFSISFAKDYPAKVCKMFYNGNANIDYNSSYLITVPFHVILLLNFKECLFYLCPKRRLFYFKYSIFMSINVVKLFQSKSFKQISFYTYTTHFSSCFVNWVKFVYRKGLLILLKVLSGAWNEIAF